MTSNDKPAYKPGDYGITPLGDHLAASNDRGRNIAIGLGLLVGTWIVAILLSGWATGVIVAGAVIVLVVTTLAYRTRRADHLETDRLLDEQARRDLGGKL